MKFLSYPKKIIHGHKLNFILKELGIPHTNNISEDGITHIIHYDYKNVNTVSNEVFNLYKRIINADCLNVKKDYVDDVFKFVFGYSSLVEPETHKGSCVIKSTQQAVHNGTIVSCPIKRDDKIYWSKTGVAQKRIYQKLIDTRFEMDKLREFRIPIINFEIPLIFVKELGIKSTFHPYSENHYNVYSDCVYNWFDLVEVEKIISFTKEFRFEFGEIDVLRDNSTGLIYIVDVNNIPMGTLFSHIKDRGRCIKLMAESFKKML